jgi:hypothetical protein
MRSQPTLPRRRGSLQPDSNWLRPKNRLSDSSSAARKLAAGPLPRPQVERFSKERGITSRIPSVAFPRSRIPHHPSPRPSLLCRRGRSYRRLYIVPTRFDAGNSQALIVVNRSIPFVLALVGIPAVFPRRRHLKTRDRVQRETPESNALAIWATTEEAKSPSEIKANNSRRILPPLRPSRRADRYCAPCRKFSSDVKSGWLNKRAKNDCCSQLVAGIGSLRLPV